MSTNETKWRAVVGMAPELCYNGKRRYYPHIQYGPGERDYMTVHAAIGGPLPHDPSRCLPGERTDWLAELAPHDRAALRMAAAPEMYEAHVFAEQDANAALDMLLALRETISKEARMEIVRRLETTLTTIRKRSEAMQAKAEGREP